MGNATVQGWKVAQVQSALQTMDTSTANQWILPGY